MPIKEYIRKNSVIYAVIGLLTAAVTAYSNIRIEEEKTKRERNEIFFSDYQDKIECQLTKYDSVMKVKTCQ